MLGIYDCFGYNVSFPERYKLIKKAGFDCVMLWWSDRFGRGEGYEKDAGYAREAGLKIENIHTPVHQQNCISQRDNEGEGVFQTYIQCVKDCAKLEISTMVIHLPDDNHLINELGMERLKEIVTLSVQNNVKVAFENLNNIQNLQKVMTTIKDSNAGLCYDSCHHANYAPEVDLLNDYKDRLMAIHLQDNGGKHNQHQLPFDGKIDWATLINKLATIGYQGATTLEPMNWDYEDISIEEFLQRAFLKASRLEQMRRLHENNQLI